MDTGETLEVIARVFFEIIGNMFNGFFFALGALICIKVFL